MKSTKTQKATKQSKIPTPPTPAPAPAPPTTEAATPKAVTKKSICIELLSRKGGATLDEMAQVIADRGICDDLKVNRLTAGLWMRKIGFDVTYDKESKKYSRA